MKFSLIHLLLLGITFLISSILLNRKFEIYSTWITVIKRFAPIWLICFLPFLSYFIICGTISMLATEAYKHMIGGLENFDPSFFMMLEKRIEYLCSFFIPLVYFYILKREKFRFFWAWAIIIAITHSLTAGYRDPKLIFDTLNPTFLETGPQLLTNIQLFDASIPLLSLLTIYIIYLYRRLNRFIINDMI